MLNRDQINYLLVHAYNAAIRAGASILDIYTGDRNATMIPLKDDCSPITVADKESHEVIKQYLNQTRIPLLSEEGRDLLYEERRNWDLFWLVDPLDGTKEFLRGNGEFTVNIALICNNEPVIGVIYVPYIHKIYFGLKGEGSFLAMGIHPDHHAIHTLEDIQSHMLRLPLQSEGNTPIRIAVSRSHNTQETFEHIDQIKIRHPQAEMVEQGSSYKFCMLAEAIVEVYVRTSNTYEWDTAAGEIILTEAGGKVRSLENSGAGLQYNKVSLHNPHFICHSKYYQGS